MGDPALFELTKTVVGNGVFGGLFILLFFRLLKRNDALESEIPAALKSVASAIGEIKTAVEQLQESVDKQTKRLDQHEKNWRAESKERKEETDVQG